MVLSSESFLIRSNRVIDPFNRLGAIARASLTVIEFCQIEGPRPLAMVHTTGGGVPIDIDSLSVWLMSSETATGTVLCLYNQQSAVYALSYHFTIYDIKARAFQRPLCLAYLSSSKPTGELISKFTLAVRKLLVPFVSCNRKLFLSQLNDVISLSDSIENDTVQSYYNLNPDDVMSIMKNQKFINASEQARKLKPRMSMLYEELSCTDSIASDCAGHRTTERELAEQAFLSFRANDPLEHIKDLAPCAYGQFISSLKPLLSHLYETIPKRGILYSGAGPILKFPKYESPMKEKRTSSSEVESEDEETLKQLCLNLDNILFPILAGQTIIVSGSVQRKRTVIDLVNKLNLLKPKSHSNHEVKSWVEDLDNIPSGIVGVCATKKEKEFLLKTKSVLLDTNTSTLHLVPYQGKLLADLHCKRKFPTDNCLQLFLTAALSRLCMLVYYSKHTALNALKEEELSLDDEMIISNLLAEVDLIRYQSFKDSISKKLSQRNLSVKQISL
ncbi:unnamed protein product [Auanema sp. JU1783]|nr:unnamed protein product [Auanema sp. JU1783]